MNFIFNNIALACDHAGYDLKNLLVHYGQSLNLCLKDLGSFSNHSVDYPDFAQKLCQDILDHHFDAGILICGTGIGMSITANRYQGIRAAVCNDGVTGTKLSRAHNNANILCLGSRLIGTETAKDCFLTFLTTPFDNSISRHQCRLDKIDKISLKNF